MVASGRVTVNGQKADVGQLVDPAADSIAVDGKTVGSGEQQRIYLAMAKPAGVTSTVSDRHASQTVVDLVPPGLRRGAARIYPIGRLDRDSEGLLLLTNDGTWAQRILHPSHGIEREYAAGLDRPIDELQRKQLIAGVLLEEGRAELAGLRLASSADVRLLRDLIGPDAQQFVWYIVTLRQGMKRQVRRMFGAVDAQVRRLVRTRFGTLRVAGMTLGDVRALSAAERRQLDSLSQADDSPQTAKAPRGLIVSIDGPGGSGKSSVGAAAARTLGYRFCDTGVLYRGLAWLALERRVDPDDAAALTALIDDMELTPDESERYVRLTVGDREVTDELHTAAVDREVSRVSRHADVRARLLPVQRALAAPGRIIMAGRDIGSVVLADADLKIYLDVSIEERARRRSRERGVQADDTAVRQIEDELRRRDGVDSTRKTAPLRVPDGALVLSTDGNTLQQTVDEVVATIKRRELETGGNRR